MAQSEMRRRRGVAMLLVLISLMMATILSVSYLASRDNSPAIGENVASSAAARWAADSALEMGVAILQTDSNWRTGHIGGKLVDDLDMSGALIDIDITDLASGGPPTEKTVDVRMTATALVNGIAQQATAVAYVPLTNNQGADVDLSEFAIFASDQIELSGDATVTRWPTVRLSDLGLPVNLGTQAMAAGSVRIDNNAAVIDATVYTNPGASNLLIIDSAGTGVDAEPLPDDVPMPDSPGCGQSATSSPAPAPMTITGGINSSNVSRRASTITISGNARHTLAGNIVIVSEGDITLQNAKLVVNGKVKIVAFDDLVLQNAAIELTPNARLTLYVGNSVTLQDSYVGDVRSTTVRDNSGKASAMNVDYLRAYRLPGSATEATWALAGNSVMKASVYAKNTEFRIQQTSALYGRVAAKAVRLSESGALFYDPQQNSRTGYTKTDGPLYGGDQLLKPAFKALAALDTLLLQSAANASQTDVYNAEDGELCESATDTEPAPTIVPPDQPTPRPVQVQVQIASYGMDVGAWENE